MKTYIYHITHIRNLELILQHGCLWCDNERNTQSLASVGIAHEHIKQRRSVRKVSLGRGGTLADYVPFYFAPRAPMLYAIHTSRVANYADGQKPVLHLVSSAEAVTTGNLPFVFTNGHAEIAYSKFYDNLKDLDQVDWSIMKETWWKDTDDDGDRKRRRQAEFLVHRSFPFSLISAIGVYSGTQAAEVKQILAKYDYQIPVIEQRNWYY